MIRTYFHSLAIVFAAASSCMFLPQSSHAAGNAPQPTICTRGCWGARAAGSISYMSSINRAIVHHTAGNEFSTTGYEDSKANVRAIQNLHMNANGWSDIGYHFLVDKFGNTFEGRYGSMSSFPRGAHDGTNANSFGFNAMGYFHPDRNDVPTAAMMNALYDVIAWRMPNGWQPYGSPGTYGPLGYNVGYVDSHRRVKSTACPGDNLHNPYVGSNVNAGTIRAEIQSRINGGTPPPYNFTSNTEGFTAGAGCTQPWHTGTNWSGSIVTDQTGNDAHIMGPVAGFDGNAGESVHVSFYPQNGSTASHDMQVFWRTAAENFMDPGKASATYQYTAKDRWVNLNLSVNHAKWAGQRVNQMRLDFDGVNPSVRWIINHIVVQQVPRNGFGASPEGYATAGGMGPIQQTSAGWPGIIYADQTGNDGFFIGPVINNYFAAENDHIYVNVYPQNGNTANHDMKIYWATAAENYFSESKSSPVQYYTAKDGWHQLAFAVGSMPGWNGSAITRLRVDVDDVNKGNRWIIDHVIIDHAQ